MGYYFISIGGSGTRVLESLTHLTVAGMLPNKEKEGHLYAMAIDPDTGNGNLTRTNTLLTYVNAFKNLKVGEHTPLLKTPIKLANPFTWSPTDLGTNLDRVIFYQNYRAKPIGKLYESLYTEKERNTILDEGFRGRPSIGAAVMGMNAMTAVTQDSAWAHLIDSVRNDVRTNGSAKIFLSGSVFGGTGAAGLPTIARIIRETFKDFCNEGKLRIGGALLLPYFSFTPSAQEKADSGLFASSENFLTNTKAALRYYADNGGSGYDSLYFVGDDTMTPTPNFSVGAGSQKNDAHIVDFFAAMAAAHFYQGIKGQHCYFISRSQEECFKWQDLPDINMYDQTKISLRVRFGQFVRFIFAYLYIVKPVVRDLFAGKDSHAFPWFQDYWKDKIDVNSAEVRNFEEYAEQFVLWIDQVEHSVSRTVELINPKSFKCENNKISIVPELFPTLDYGSSKLTLDDIAAKINKGESKGFWPWSKKNNSGSEDGFGLFLRRLYDSCAV